MIQVGDFVAQICSDNATISKKGIVIEVDNGHGMGQVNVLYI